MKLLITGAWRFTQEQREILEDMGTEVMFMQNENDALPEGWEETEGVIGNGLFLHHDIKKFEKLRYIQLTSAGFDRVPMGYVADRGITIHNARGVYSIPMAEFAVCGVLQLLKHSRFFTKSQSLRKWEKDRTIGELFGKTACVIGCGSVGTEVAKRFAAFGCEIVGVDLYPRKDENYSVMYALCELEEALKRSHIVVLTLPLTEDTKHLVCKNTLCMMNPGTILVNIARGQIVNTEDLIEAIRCQTISGAALDVFEEEPLSSDSPLWEMENVIITPHNSFVGDGNNNRLWAVIKNNLESYL